MVYFRRLRHSATGQTPACMSALSGLTFLLVISNENAIILTANKWVMFLLRFVCRLVRPWGIVAYWKVSLCIFIKLRKFWFFGPYFCSWIIKKIRKWIICTAVVVVQCVACEEVGLWCWVNYFDVSCVMNCAMHCRRAGWQWDWLLSLWLSLLYAKTWRSWTVTLGRSSCEWSTETSARSVVKRSLTAPTPSSTSASVRPFDLYWRQASPFSYPTPLLSVHFYLFPQRALK